MASHPFDKHYFHGGGKVGGYAGAGYRDFPVHWATYEHVMKRKPKSVLELGCARGYVLKRIADYADIPVMGIEISRHCYLTRAIDRIATHDITKVPWPALDGTLVQPEALGDKAFDLCVSVAVLEHIPEHELSWVFGEMARTCERGLHGIDVHDDDGFDKTHHTIRDLAWWRERLPPGHEAVDKEELEAGPIILPPDINDGIKLNLGSFTTMFHGWRNLDALDLSSWARREGYAFTRCDLTQGIPYDDGIVDLIFLSHVLEHFDYEAGERLLRECHRVLRPGGVIRIAVPDTQNLAQRYLDDDLDSLSEICGVDVEQASPAKVLQELLFGGDHRALYDRQMLLDSFVRAGFSKDLVASFGFRESRSRQLLHETVDLYPEMSLFVEAVR